MKQGLKPRFGDGLRTALAGNLPPAVLATLPNGFQKMGSLAVLSLRDDALPFKKTIGEAALALTGCKTVCVKTGAVAGAFRQPSIEVAAGEENTAVDFVESGCRYRFDAAKIMFSKGNLSERRRIASLVSDGETVFDFFAGIGYFTIPIAVLAKPARVLSFEWNPEAFKWLEENIALNHAGGVATPFFGDCTEEAPKASQALELKADRVILGLLPAPKRALPTAFAVANPKGAWLHYEGVALAGKPPTELEEDVLQAAREAGFNAEVKNVELVKSFGPRREHVVLDVLANKPGSQTQQRVFYSPPVKQTSDG